MDMLYAREELGDESEEETEFIPELVKLKTKEVDSDSSSDEEGEEEPPRFIVLPTSSQKAVTSVGLIDAAPYSSASASKFGKNHCEWKTRPLVDPAKVHEPVMRRGYGKSVPIGLLSVPTCLLW